VKEVILVSAGLGLDGGGSALLGRLCAAATAAYCRERGRGFRVLHLAEDLGADAQEALGGIAVRSFGGRQRDLALAVLSEQVRRPRPPLILGIEVWGPLSWDRRRALAGAAPIAISEHTRRRARERHPWLGTVDVLPLALEERPPAGEADAALLDRLGTGFLLIVGRMSAHERYKGHDELLEALRILHRSRPGTRLVVAGGGDDRPRLQARSAELGLDGAVTFTGFVSEATLAELYRRAAVFALPSRDEGFGLVYLEAMRAGRPCVALRGTAAAEVVRDGETGLLVDAGPESLAAALLRLLEDPDLADRLGEAGRRHWQRELSVAAFRGRLNAHLDRLLAT
jgi:phosphatidylinositol alpha-1,6-mannosyltransferase